MLVFIPRSASLHFFNGLRYNPRLKQKFVSLVENTTWVIAMKGFRSGFDHFSFFLHCALLMLVSIRTTVAQWIVMFVYQSVFIVRNVEEKEAMV